MATVPTKDPIGLNTPLPASEVLRKRVMERVKEYMSRFDASHDYQHIMRVLKLAERLFADTPAGTEYDETAIHLAALLHDVGDRKYIKPGENAETLVATILIEGGASIELAQKVWTIVRNVSFSNEVKNPDQVQRALRDHPELAIVQDADRLDSLGGVGIGRAFAYGGAHGRTGLQGSIDHFEEKLFKISAWMKTDLGREMARERTARLHQFKSWWEEECEVIS
ncbi:HD domain-containing protein [Saccharata proteae CBS 121410]|uniref:HD domain-containing protein n=1 Tax=Saccharata proteae CBS 121410 TaxID=1314787 RepID=A0A9P4LX44_9PEZI|nr:HD domain-containing protein [Saccharata proteae CBS 121410]